MSGLRDVESGIVIAVVGGIGYLVYKAWKKAQELADDIHDGVEAVKDQVGQATQGVVLAGEFGTPQYFVDTTKMEFGDGDFSVPQTTTTQAVGTGVAIATNPGTTGRVIGNFAMLADNPAPVVIGGVASQLVPGNRTTFDDMMKDLFVSLSGHQNKAI